MNDQSLAFVFLSAAVINNFVLALFLGICPFLGVSGKRDTALRMGIAVTFVMLVSSAAAFGVNAVLERLGAEYLRLIAYIAVIASAVQLVELFVKRFSPVLSRTLGIYLPLITTNCAILGVALFQTIRQYTFAQAIVFALGAGVGFTIAIVIMSGLREELHLADVPDAVRGTALTLLVAGLLSLSFMGFSGLGGAG